MGRKAEEWIHAGAKFSLCRRYRYSLHRQWAAGNNTCLWIMLNPSTADERILDPTVRRCLAFSRGWGYSSMTVCNLFAWRATDPKGLWAPGVEPIGVDNDEWILREARKSMLVVCAWGVHGTHLDRNKAVLSNLQQAGIALSCLQFTRDGHPAHPLYLRKELAPVPYGDR